MANKIECVRYISGRAALRSDLFYIALKATDAVVFFRVARGNDFRSRIADLLEIDTFIVEVNREKV